VSAAGEAGTTDAVEDAARVLRAGGLVAFPTETVYGLGADARNPAALHRLYAVKGRPARHPVIVHLPAGPSLAGLLGGWAAALSEPARALSAACWPGPLTLVVRRGDGVLDQVTGGRDTVGLRVPDDPLAQALLRRFGDGVAAPSANRFGRVSPTSAEHVRSDLGDDVDVILDGGRCRVGVESTVVDCSEPDPVVLRLGGLPRERVAEIVGRPVAVHDDGSRPAPGTLASHYAPRAQVVLVEVPDVTSRAAALLATGARVGLLASTPPPDLPGAVELLRAPAGAEQLARELYALLRAADGRHVDVLLVVSPPPVGLGAAIADRLARAAAASASAPEAAR
jgi:L-threonylcarbamoyladenylate synthase